MLNRIPLRSQAGSAMVTALMVMLVVLPLGLALLAIVDTQAKDSGRERARDRAFNLADGALSSAAFSFSRYNWPSSAATAPSNTGATGTAGACGSAALSATLGGATAANSTTSKLQPNLNASFDDSAYSGATWQISVCDDIAGSQVWDEALNTTQWNYDANHNDYVWVRSEAQVGGRKRVIAALVHPAQVPALSSKYGLVTGRLNSDVTNAAGTLLTGGLLGSVTSALLDADGLVAADPLYAAPATGVTALRCGALDGCLTGTLAGASSLAIFDTLVTGGKLVHAGSPTAASAAAILQFKQQAEASGTYVASTAGKASATDAALPACVIPAAANAETIVYIDQVGSGSPTSANGPGDQYCYIDASTSPAYKALVIGRGRVVVRGNNSTSGGTFRGLIYALNQQRETLGDASLPTREVIRIDRGAHVIGGVAADGKSAQVGIYPPTMSCGALNLLCLIGNLLNSTLSFLGNYNPAITSNKALMDKVTVSSTVFVVPGTYKDIAGEQH